MNRFDTKMSPKCREMTPERRHFGAKRRPKWHQNRPWGTPAEVPNTRLQKEPFRVANRRAQGPIFDPQNR